MIKNIIKIYHWQLEYKALPPEYYFDEFAILSCNILLLAYIPLKL